MDWFIWGPVLAKTVTIQELKTSYTTSELFELHEAMDIKQALEDDANEKASRKAK